MKIIAISDTHMSHPELPKGDILIHAGDFSYRGTLPECNDFFTWIDNIKKNYRYVIFCSGNHDFLPQTDPGLFKSLIPEGVVYLQDELIEIEGLKIYGTPWTPKFFNWAFMKERGTEINKVWDKIPEGIDILISHGPCQGILDNVPKNFLETEFENVGCRDLRNQVLNRIKPKLMISGHIHYDGGKSRSIENTDFYNCSVMSESYTLVNSPTIIEI